jgi:hypothetical protein
MGQVAFKTVIASHRFMDYPALVFLDQFSMAFQAILTFWFPLLLRFRSRHAPYDEQGKANKHHYTPN